MGNQKLEVTRREFMLLAGALTQAGNLAGEAPGQPGQHFGNSWLQVALVGSRDCLWSYHAAKSGREHRFGPPVFNLEGNPVAAILTHIERSREPVHLNNGATEYSYRGTFATEPELSLEMLFRVADDNPVVRFRYVLSSTKPHTLAKPAGTDDLAYLDFTLGDLPQAKEIRFSNFVELSHSYTLEEVRLDPRQFEDQLGVMGPMMVACDGRHSMLVAYEHGSQVPDAFLQFKLAPGRRVKLRAAKGNYVNGQAVGGEQRYETVWLHAGAMEGDEDELASRYRSFILKHLTENLGSRKPCICYNTWNFQERNKWDNGKKYLDSMNEERMLSEVDAAHRMGIDVFVLDTGWYARTGEWAVSRQRFPDGMKRVKAKLDGYGMRLGLWFGPVSAAASSDAYLNHKDCVMTWQGVERQPHPIWETEESYPLCLVSRYAEAFADQLIHVANELGVTYFKWDAVDLYGCDSAHHLHGNASNSPEERVNSYAFQLIRQMSRIADRLAKACPDAIIDYDVTENGRAVGLGFLSSGRFFLINNGPYYNNYNIPFNRETSNSNLFFHAGPARTWICRSPLGFDKWIPSILFLTHYFPDDPLSSQEVNVASLMLGQNGIWGDLPAVSASGADYLGAMLSRYKQVSEAVTEADPVVTGRVSGSPEIHEKISAESGKGMVAVFATRPGKYTYLTRNRAAAPHWAGEGAQVTFDSENRAVLSLDFAQPGAKVVFFGGE